MTQWQNNPHIGEIQDKILKMKYNQQLYFIAYTNISMQTPLYDAQTYQYKLRYNSGEVTESLLNNNIYNKLPNTENSWGAHCVKSTNVSHRTYIFLPIALVKYPWNIWKTYFVIYLQVFIEVTRLFSYTYNGRVSIMGSYYCHIL